MPEISRFYGMVVAMFFNDHEPPHFHVRYGTHKAILDAVELEEDWRRARASQPLKRIDPLQ